MGPPDGGIFMDYRDLATYRHDGLSKEQAASNYVWDFHIYLANELKKTHPDKYLLYMSGMGAQLIFNHIRPDSLPDNIIYPFTQPYSAYRVLNSTNNAVINYRKPWLKLQPKGVKSPIWDYFLYYRTTTPRYPVIFSQSLQQEMQEMETYADGKFIEVRAEYMLSGTQGANKDRIAIVPLMHLMMYVQMKLFWDPELDMKALLEEYYQLYFGPAAAEMKEFHEFAEAVWNRQESRSITSSTGFLKEQDVAQYFEILSRAKEKAGQNSVHYNRIAAMEKEMESLEKLFPNLKRTGPDYRAHWTPQPWDLDGNVDKYKYNWVTLQDNMTAKKITRNLTKVALALPRQKKDYLTVAAICYENKMANLKADCKLNDDVSIFQDDVLEVYINTPERSYFKVVVNSNGAIYDESHDATIVERDTLPVLWNPDCKAVVKKYDDRWTVELMIPTGDFGKLGPTKEYPWGIQVARTRYAGGTSETFSLAPTGGRYDTMNKWGNLWMR